MTAEKKRYVRFRLPSDFLAVTVTPDVADEMITSGEWAEYSREDVYMTEAEFEAMEDV